MNVITLTGEGENIYAGDGENLYAEIGVDDPGFEGNVGLNTAAEAKAATLAESAQLEVLCLQSPCRKPTRQK